MKHLSWTLLMSVGMVMLAGCAGKGEGIDIVITGGNPTGGTVAMATPGTRIAVLPFDDHRPNQTHLGIRSHLWAGISYFDLPSGTLAKTTAQALGLLV